MLALVNAVIMLILYGGLGYIGLKLSQNSALLISGIQELPINKGF